MPYDLTEPREQETGFGTGLRRQLERRLMPPNEQQPEETVAQEPAVEGRSEVDELWAELEAARSLLGEAYPESAPPERSLMTEQDELAGLRARRAFNQPS